MADKILVVEDNAEVREVLKTYLENVLGFEVITASDGVRALQLLRSQKPELKAAILDIMMRSHGGTVADFLKKDPQYKDTVIIYHTALTQEQVDKRILEGAHFVHKGGDSLKEIAAILRKELR